MALTLKAWRRAKEITQEQMAEALGVHVNTYISWESEPCKMSIENGYKACAILNIEFNDVIFLQENATNM